MHLSKLNSTANPKGMFPQLPSANVGLLLFSPDATHTQEQGNTTSKQRRPQSKTKQAGCSKFLCSLCQVKYETRWHSSLFMFINFRHNSLEPMSKLVVSIPGFQLTHLVSSNKVCWNNSSCYKSTNSPSSKTFPKVLSANWFSSKRK